MTVGQNLQPGTPQSPAIMALHLFQHLKTFAIYLL